MTTATIKLTAADVRALPHGSVCVYASKMWFVSGRGHIDDTGLILMDRWEQDSEDPAWTLLYCPDPAWVPPSQRQPAPPAAPALDGWRAKCITKWNDSRGHGASFAELDEGGPYLQRDGKWGFDEQIVRWSTPEERDAALAIADPPPNCTEPDAVAERQGVGDAKNERWSEIRDVTKAGWYRRGYDRQRAKMEAQPAKPDELAAAKAEKVDLAKVICPACSHQFGAISQNDQEERSRLREKLEDTNIRLSNALRRIAELEASEKSLRTVIDTSKGTATSFVDLIRKRVSRGNEFDIGDVEDIAHCVVELADRLADVEARPATVVKGAQK